MEIYYYLYIVFLIIGIGISVYLITKLWTLRKTPGAYNLIWAMASVVWWSFAYIFEILFGQFQIKNAWSKSEYLGIPFVAVALFTFALIYSGRGKWLTRGTYALMLFVPITSCLLALTNDWHGLLWSTVEMPVGSTVGPLTVGHGPWYIINIAYSYLMLLLATLIFAQVAFRSHSLYRSQAVIMLTGMIIPWIGNIIYILHLGPAPSLDWTPLALTLTTIALEIGFARFGLFDILPVAENTAFNAMRDGVIVADKKGRVVQINPAAEAIFQQQEDRTIGQDVHRLIPNWDEWNSGAPPTSEISHEVILGEGVGQRTFSLRVTPILDRRGQGTGHVLILTDITEQKRSQSEVLLQSTALEAAVNGIVITDAQGNIEWTNAAFSRLTGYGREEALGKNPKILKSGKQPDSFYQQMWKTIAAGMRWKGELINRRKDGSFYYEEMTIAPLVENGKITHFIAIKQDITARKNAEEQLHQAHQEAVEANNMKTQLLASVSHDLRTPLGAIMGYAEMLQAGVFGPVNGEQEKASAEILDSTNQLLAFVNNLIGQAQIETGRLVLKDGKFKPAELVAGISSTISYMARKKGLALETTIDPALPEEIRGDPYWLRQIVVNLMFNAVKFTEAGSVKICFIKPDGGHWAIQVADTGIGIPNESQKIIFDAFRQLDSSAAGRPGGSGLGLSIVQQLTRLLGGRIELQSEVGRGSTFTVILPLTAA